MSRESSVQMGDADMSHESNWQNDHINKMGTRKNPVHFGRVITKTIGTRLSDNESSNDSQAKLLLK